ncbi:MarR family transcriptional regulator [Limosilactobacillus sp. RRLNB_1_1]|uniref:MarR family transcriptional regulator n=2 Tax=Limosilactobacillus albertensis TaxID=2759752 RepID=A0A7W3TRB9_9LACO|nr:MarR family transcriptional regulator [Limosilactobacillus albertensis]
MSLYFNLHYSYKRVTYRKLGTKRVSERKNLMATSEELTKELFSFSNEIHQRIIQSHRAHSAFIGRGKILWLLANNDYVYQNQLAKLAKIKPGSLTQILEKMEHEQLIIRKRDHNDKRLIYVRLSNKGKEQFQKNEKYHRDFQEFMTAPLTPAEIDQFVTTLTILRKQFNTYIDQHQKEMRNK